MKVETALKIFSKSLLLVLALPYRNRLVEIFTLSHYAP